MPRRGRPFAVRDDKWWNDRIRIDEATGCHVWTKVVCRYGYGRVSVNGGKSPVLVHRIAYERANGPFDQSLSVCHRCDNPSCINPEHLFLGTHADNMRDMFAKGRNPGRGKDKKPRKRRRHLTLSRTQVPEVSEPGSRDGAQVVDSIPLINGLIPWTSVATLRTRWQRVTNVPPLPHGHDGPSWNWPRLRTSENPAERLSVAPLPRLRETE